MTAVAAMTPIAVGLTGLAAELFHAPVRGRARARDEREIADTVEALAKVAEAYRI
jgi:hypothetical protein